MQKGIKNELDFVLMINGKKLNNLPNNMQDLICTIFKDVKSDSKIICWKSKYFEKADIKIKIDSVIKGISIKSGNNSSIHQENINSLNPFLLKIGLDNYVINLLNNYLQGYVNNERVKASTYCEYHKEEMKSLENSFNDYYIKTNLLLRFIFQGTEIHKYDCDAIILGTPVSFVWATKNEILEYLVNSGKETNSKSSIPIGRLTLKSYDRNLRGNQNKTNCQDDIQIKWINIKQDLEYITKIREAQKILKSNLKIEE